MKKLGPNNSFVIETLENGQSFILIKLYKRITREIEPKLVQIDDLNQSSLQKKTSLEENQLNLHPSEEIDQQLMEIAEEKKADNVLTKNYQVSIQQINQETFS